VPRHRLAVVAAFAACAALELAAVDVHVSTQRTAARKALLATRARMQLPATDTKSDDIGFRHHRFLHCVRTTYIGLRIFVERMFAGIDAVSFELQLAEIIA